MNRKLVQLLVAGLLMTQVLAGQERPDAGSESIRQQRMTNSVIERLIRERRSEEEILKTIDAARKAGTAEFDISPTALVELHKKGASDRVLNAMMGDGSVRYGRPSALAAGPSNNTPFVGADALNPQPFPPKSKVPGTLAKLTLTKGPEIRISGIQSSVPLKATQVIQEQTTQRLTESRTAPSPSVPRQSNTTPAVALRTAPSTMMMRPNTVGTMGAARTMGATTDPAADGSTPDPTGGTTPPAGTPGTTTGSTPGTTVAGQPSTGANPTGTTPPAGKPISRDAMLHAPKPIDPCILNSKTPIVKTVSGRAHDIYFTPDPGTGVNPNNQYTLIGCNFGAAQGQGYVQLVAGFKNNPTPVKLGVDLWSDTLIEVTFNPNFQNEYDMDNVTLVVASSTGGNTQITGNHFVATRASRPLTRIPSSLVKLPTIAIANDRFASPVTMANLQVANMPVATIAGTVQFQQYAQLWDSNVGDGYPQQRISYGESIDFSKLNAGFQVDGTIQTFIVQQANPGGWGSCKFGDTQLGATMQGSSLGIGVQPAECDDTNTKFMWAYYGLGMTVTGPAGTKLDPWPNGLN